MTRPVPPSTQALQWSAADPLATTWVSANAGSGKTHVLTQRVIRLLLDKVPPSKILCLTFTKAAAANMALRIFETLGKWTMLDDAMLRAAIAATGANVDRARLAYARRLFARTVETPGGLKIQTIHAFCERLLHLFPFEADVPSRFEVIEAEAQAELLARAKRDVLDHPSDTAVAQALLALSDECGTFGFDAVIADVIAQHSALAPIFASGINWAETYRATLAAALAIDADATPESIDRGLAENGIPRRNGRRSPASSIAGRARISSERRHCAKRASRRRVNEQRSIARSFSPIRASRANG